jgi:hypothetical protein
MPGGGLGYCSLHSKVVGLGWSRLSSVAGITLGHPHRVAHVLYSDTLAWYSAMMATKHPELTVNRQ